MHKIFRILTRPREASRHYGRCSVLCLRWDRVSAGRVARERLVSCQACNVGWRERGRQLGSLDAEEKASGLHAGPAGPHERIAPPPDRCPTGALGYTQVLSSASEAKERHPHLIAIVFSKAGKTILDPSMRTVHTPPGLSADRPGDEKATDNCRGSRRPLRQQSCRSLPLKDSLFARSPLPGLASPEPLFAATKHIRHYMIDMTRERSAEIITVSTSFRAFKDMSYRTYP